MYLEAEKLHVRIKELQLLQARNNSKIRYVRKSFSKLTGMSHFWDKLYNKTLFSSNDSENDKNYSHFSKLNAVRHVRKIGARVTGQSHFWQKINEKTLLLGNSASGEQQKLSTDVDQHTNSISSNLITYNNNSSTMESTSTFKSNSTETSTISITNEMTLDDGDNMTSNTITSTTIIVYDPPNNTDIYKNSSTYEDIEVTSQQGTSQLQTRQSWKSFFSWN